MRLGSLLLTSLIFGFALTTASAGDEADAVKTYALGDYAGVARLLEPGYRAKTINIQQSLILARAYLHLG